MTINNIEVNVDLMNPYFLDKYTKAISEISAIDINNNFAGTCDLIKSTFISLFGEDKTVEILGDEPRIDVWFNAFNELNTKSVEAINRITDMMNKINTQKINKRA